MESRGLAGPALHLPKGVLSSLRNPGAAPGRPEILLGLVAWAMVLPILRNTSHLGWMPHFVIAGRVCSGGRTRQDCVAESGPDPELGRLWVDASPGRGGPAYRSANTFTVQVAISPRQDRCLAILANGARGGVESTMNCLADSLLEGSQPQITCRLHQRWGSSPFGWYPSRMPPGWISSSGTGPLPNPSPSPNDRRSKALVFFAGKSAFLMV